ncbi:hypothetical protein [Pseudomonas sp. RL_35y_Pfl2_P42]|uniref:hypothetical protein n=1 Tax=Pseudomonas sp. RL_35y_Pfl2_P42 TaxID=3088710 RepID=UPI0030D83237
MTSTRTIEPFALPLPKAPKMIPLVPASEGVHGGVAFDDASEEEGFQILMLAYDNQSENDKITLWLNDEKADDTTIAKGKERDNTPLYIPPEWFQKGLNKIKFSVKRTSGNCDFTDELILLHRTSPPGDTPPVLNLSVSHSSIGPEQANKVSVTVNYKNMNWYDTISIYCNGARVTHTLTPDSTSPLPPVPQSVVIPIPKEKLEQGGDDSDFEFKFRVVDYLTNPSGPPTWSDVVTVDVHLNRLTLPAPTVKGQTGNNFSPTQPEVRVLVPQGSLLPDDKLNVIWQGAAETPAAGTYTSPQRLVSAGLEIAVPRSVLAYSLGKPVTVIYVIEHNGASSNSLPLSLNILTLPATALIPPKIVEADANNVLDVNALGSKNATLHGLLHTLIEAGQQVWMSLEGQKADASPHNLTIWNGGDANVNATWVSQGFWPAALANSYLKELGHGTTLKIKYKVSMDKSDNPATATVFPDRTYSIKSIELVVPTLVNVLDASNKEVPEGTSTISTTLKLKGKASKGQTVEIFDGNGASAVSKGTAPAHETTGEWEKTIAVPEGSRRLYAKALYAVSPVYSNVRLLTVIAATAPTITSVKGSPSGVEIPPGGTTAETAVTLTGSAAKGQKVDILDGITSKGQPDTDQATGIWTLTVTGLSVAAHSFTAKALYGDGATSEAWTVNVTANVLSFINQPYRSSPGVRLKDIEIFASKLDGTPRPEAPVILTLASGMFFADGTGGEREFIADGQGLVIVKGVQASMVPGEYALNAVSEGAIASAKVTVFPEISEGDISIGTGGTEKALSPDGLTLYVLVPSASLVKVVDLISRKVLNHTQTPPIALSWPRMAISPDGKQLFIGYTHSGNITIIDTTNLKIIGDIKVNQSPHYLAVSPDGKSLAVGYGGINSSLYNIQAAIVDISTQRITREITEAGSNTKMIDYTPDGEYLYILIWVGNAGTLAIIETKTHSTVARIIINSRPYTLHFNASGTRAHAIGNTLSWTPTITVVDVLQMQPIRTISPLNEIKATAFVINASETQITYSEGTVIDAAGGRTLKKYPFETGCGPVDYRNNRLYASGTDTIKVIAMDP